MNRKPIDRPFRSREEVEMEQALREQYRQIAIEDVVEALPVVKSREATTVPSD
ncbi:MAG: hypothetical protein KIS96_03810 [Bauldia sp.]|nr:hypothetical protein [Bauldia sp.]